MIWSTFEHFIFSSSRRPISYFKRSKRGRIWFLTHLQTPYISMSRKKAAILNFLRKIIKILYWEIMAHCAASPSLSGLWTFSSCFLLLLITLGFSNKPSLNNLLWSPTLNTTFRILVKLSLIVLWSVESR